MSEQNADISRHTYLPDTKTPLSSHLIGALRDGKTCDERIMPDMLILPTQKVIGVASPALQALYALLNATQLEEQIARSENAPPKWHFDDQRTIISWLIGDILRDNYAFERTEIGFKSGWNLTVPKNSKEQKDPRRAHAQLKGLREKILTVLLGESRFEVTLQAPEKPSSGKKFCDSPKGAREFLSYGKTLKETAKEFAIKASCDCDDPECPAKNIFVGTPASELFLEAGTAMTSLGWQLIREEVAKTPDADKEFRRCGGLSLYNGFEVHFEKKESSPGGLFEMLKNLFG